MTGDQEAKSGNCDCWIPRVPGTKAALCCPWARVQSRTCPFDEHLAKGAAGGTPARIVYQPPVAQRCPVSRNSCTAGGVIARADPTCPDTISPQRSQL